MPGKNYRIRFCERQAKIESSEGETLDIPPFFRPAHRKNKAVYAVFIRGNEACGSYFVREPELFYASEGENLEKYDGKTGIAETVSVFRASIIVIFHHG